MTNDLTPAAAPSTPSPVLLADLQEIIRRGKSQAVAAVNSVLTLTYWHVGQRINTEVLRGERAAYGQQVVASVAERLVAQYGKSFETRNLRCIGGRILDRAAPQSGVGSQTAHRVDGNPRAPGRPKTPSKIMTTREGPTDPKFPQMS